MDTDDLEPTRKKLDKPDLQVMSLEQLTDYIIELEAEIARTKESISIKNYARGAAESVFKN